MTIKAVKNFIRIIIMLACSNEMHGAALKKKITYEDFNVALINYAIALSDGTVANEYADTVKKIYDQLNEFDKQQALVDIPAQGYSLDRFGIKVIAPHQVAKKEKEHLSRGSSRPRTAPPAAVVGRRPSAVAAPQAATTVQTAHKKAPHRTMPRPIPAKTEAAASKEAAVPKKRPSAVVTRQATHKQSTYGIRPKPVGQRPSTKTEATSTVPSTRRQTTQHATLAPTTASAAVPAQAAQIKQQTQENRLRATGQSQTQVAAGTANKEDDKKNKKTMVQKLGALKTAESRVVFLEQFTEGGACTYNMLYDADTMYKKLEKSGNLAKTDLPVIKVCPLNWMQVAQKQFGELDALQPTTEQINQLIPIFKILPAKNYVFIENGNQILQNKLSGKDLIKELDEFNEVFSLPLLSPRINALKLQSNTIQIFFMNMGAHWFTVVAYKKNGNITYFVSDRDYRQVSNDNNAAIELLARLLQ